MSVKDTARKHNRKRKLRYFFHGGLLHKNLYINRPADIMHAWSYSERKKVAFVYSHIKRSHERAFTTEEVAQMLNRKRQTVEEYILDGIIERPAMTYVLDGTYRPYKYMWRESDVMALHDYLVTVHYGRPRKDGLVNPKPTPNKAELRAMMRHDLVYYVENDKGEKIKAFREPDW